MKTRMLVMAAFVGVSLLAAEASYTSLHAQWGGAAKGRRAAPDTKKDDKASENKAEYTVVFKDFAEQNKGADKTAQLESAIKKAGKVESVDVDKKTGTAKVVLKSGELTKEAVEKSLKDAKLEFEVEKVEKAATK